MDLRDPWALDGWTFHKTWCHWKAQYNLMEEALSNASGVIANTPTAGELFLSHFKNLTADKLIVIPNGYDEEDFRMPDENLATNGNSKSLKLVFSGSLCTQKKVSFWDLKSQLKLLLRYSPERIDPDGRTLVYILKAIEELRAEGHELGNNIKLDCLGQSSEMDKETVAESSAGDVVNFHGYVPHDEAVARILNADALFLPLHDTYGEEKSRIVPGKTYEYLATGRPVLGCLPPGDARDLIEKSSVGIIAKPTSVEEIKSALIKIDRLVKQLPKRNAPDGWIKEYSREVQSRRLSDFLNEILIAS